MQFGSRTPSQSHAIPTPLRLVNEPVLALLSGIKQRVAEAIGPEQRISYFSMLSLLKSGAGRHVSVHQAYGDLPKLSHKALTLHSASTVSTCRSLV